MTREEKAKKYDEALEWMRKVYPTLTGADKEDAEHYFPELAESKDERIRKAILEFFKLQDDNTTYSFIPKKSILAWLEKQKENPKSADSISSDCTSDAKCEDQHNEEGDFVFELRQIISSHRYSDIYGEYTNDEEGMASEILELCKCELEKQQEQAVYKNSKSEIDFADKYSHDVWEKLMSKFNSIEGYSIGCNDVSNIVLNAVLNAFKWKKEQKASINIDQLKTMMFQYLQEAANEKDDSDIEADTDKWARMIFRYDFEQKPAEWSEDERKTLNSSL